MDRITQDARRRQQVLKCAENKGVTEAAKLYGYSRKTVYKWMERYDGTPESLKDRSRAPHHSPRKQTPEELNQVKYYAKSYDGNLLLAYEKAKANGYSRSYSCFKKTAYKLIQKEESQTESAVSEGRISWRENPD